MEASDSPKYLEKYFLSGVGGVGWIVKHPVNQTKNWLIVLRDEPRESLLRSGLQFGHDRGFFRLESYRTCEVTQRRCSRHGTHGVAHIIIKFRAHNNIRSCLHK